MTPSGAHRRLHHFPTTHALQLDMPSHPGALLYTGADAARFSPDFASVFGEFNQALSEGRLHSLEGRNAINTTPTNFEEFAADLGHAYAAAA